MGFFDFLMFPADAITLVAKVVLTIVFVVLAMVIIKWLPKGKVAGLILCFVAIVIVWLRLSL